MYLSSQKKQYNFIFSMILSGLVLLVYILLIWKVRQSNLNLFYILSAIGVLTSYNIFNILTKKVREREALRKKPFPEKWEGILIEDVRYYHSLSEEDKKRFKTEIQIFLHETRITGIKTEIDDRVMVLAAASAVIPVFRLEDWEYQNLGEILIYPASFNKDFDMEGNHLNVTGMVGTGVMNRVMILSKPALIAGFENENDKSNVAIHEFAHLIDGADGTYDGIPQILLEHQYLAPWLEIMYKETQRIVDGESKMNPYASTNKIEFFAVATEYFFEHPAAMKKDKPELYEFMKKIFRQDSKSQMERAFKNMISLSDNKLSRNADCPCGSGEKYKNCCLKNARVN